MASQTSSMVFIQYLTTVFDNIQDAILLIGVEPNNTFRLLLANEGFNRGSGHTTDEIGKTVEEITTASSYKKLLKRYGEVVKNKKPIEFTEEYDVPIGKQIFEVKLLPVFSAVGECVQIACITRNITELHTLRTHIQQAAKTLEHLTHQLRQT